MQINLKVKLFPKFIQIRSVEAIQISIAILSAILTNYYTDMYMLHAYLLPLKWTHVYVNDLFCGFQIVLKSSTLTNSYSHPPSCKEIHGR